MENNDIKTKLLNVKEEENDVKLKQKVFQESKKIWIVAGPAIFTRFSTFGVTVITHAFIGHIGSTELAAYALVSTVILRFANGILLGMASALETLCGQAYGAKQYHMLGVYLQRSWLVLFITAIFLLPVFLLTSPILKLLGQDHEIADVAGGISLWLMPVVFSFLVSFTCQMYLSAQSKNMIIAYLAAATLVIHVFLSWLLTVKFKFGIPGAMISTIIAFWLPNLGQLAFIIFGGCPETWTGFSLLAFKDLWPVIKLSLSSGAMLCLELWYNSTLILLTGNMKNAEVAIDALSICLNINGWEMMISLGFLTAASVRVSNELGRGSSKAAKFSIMVTVLTSLSIGLVLFVLFLVFRGQLAYLFTDNKDVVIAVNHLSPLLCFSILLNSVQPVLSGVAVGAGWQSIVAYVNLASYYLIGMPLGVVLGYLIHFQVRGIWIGMLIGTAVQTIILVIITWRTDWDNQSKAKEMMMLAEKMRLKLLSGPTAQGSTTNDEEMGSKQDMQDWLLSVGIASPVTKESAGALYHQQLSRQLTDFVKVPLERAGRMIAMIDVYCLFNRARGTELISPEDLLQACAIWEKFDVPVMLRKFDSGVMVIQNKSHSDEEIRWS